MIDRKPFEYRPAVERADLLQLDVQEDRRRQVEVKRGRRGRLEEVLLRPDRRVHRHDDRLAVRVHRRVRDLGEELLEVVVEGWGRSESTASGMSVPIDPIGSVPCVAIGFTSILTSSSV